MGSDPGPAMRSLAGAPEAAVVPAPTLPGSDGHADGLPAPARASKLSQSERSTTACSEVTGFCVSLPPLSGDITAKNIQATSEQTTIPAPEKSGLLGPWPLSAQSTIP